MGLRFPNHPVLLTRAITDSRDIPFAWGTHDCCLAACNLIQVYTGRDPAVWFRGKYKSQVGAFRALRRYLVEFVGPVKREDLLPPVVEHLCLIMGYPETTRSWLSTGDVALVATPECQRFPTALGIIVAHRVFIAGIDRGFAAKPIEEIIRGWKV